MDPTTIKCKTDGEIGLSPEKFKTSIKSLCQRNVATMRR